jgi:Na+-driven multidrug efflux pump
VIYRPRPPFVVALPQSDKGDSRSNNPSDFVLLPAIIVLPIFFGIDGVAYAGLIADLVAFVFAISMILNEFRHMPKENQPITTKEVIA